MKHVTAFLLCACLLCAAVSTTHAAADKTLTPPAGGDAPAVVPQSGDAPAMVPPGTPVKPAVYIADINNAYPVELLRLPGINPDLANKIYAGRPYKAITDLKKRKIVPADIYKGIEPQLVVHKMKPADQ